MADEIETWRAQAAEVLDVRPELEQSGEPFTRIMETAERVPSGQSLLLIAPFEPVPLYEVLQGRGFSHETRSVAADEWIVRFTRQ